MFSQITQFFYYNMSEIKHFKGLDVLKCPNNALCSWREVIIVYVNGILELSKLIPSVIYVSSTLKWNENTEKKSKVTWKM